MRGIKTISKYVLRGLEYAFGGPNIASENLSLAQEDIFLALSKGGQRSLRIYFQEGPSRSCRIGASTEPPNQY